MFQRVLAACAVALLLVCLPSALTAQAKGARATDQASVAEIIDDDNLNPAATNTDTSGGVVFGWLAGVWVNVAAWLAGEAVLASPSSGGTGQTGCMIDPDGCPQGG